MFSLVGMSGTPGNRPMTSEEQVGRAILRFSRVEVSQEYSMTLGQMLRLAGVDPFITSSCMPLLHSSHVAYAAHKSSARA